MPTPRYILALDQGTTSSRAMLFDHGGGAIGVAQQEFRQYTRQPGHVEHDAEEIWASQQSVARQVLQQTGIAAEQVHAIGVTNQRETTILWDRHTGQPVAPAIVWQSRITAPLCDRHRSDGVAGLVREKTGLLLDAYFSATKIEYLLDQDPDLRRRAERGDILFGTVDSFLIWRLTGGQLHITDCSNASRTMLFNLQTLAWDDELLRIFRIPHSLLPQVVDSSELYGHTTTDLLGRPIPIAGCAGDQQAATFGQCCFQAGDAKNTYGTGGFLLMNIGAVPRQPPEHLLTTVGWVIAGQPTYCFEGSVFVCGAAVQWLRDGLGIIKTAQEIERLARSVDDAGGVVFVPALVGLGAPYWDPAARGGIFGITRGTNAAHLARATLEAMAHQSADVLEAMQQQSASPLTALRVDGGAAANDLLLQLQANWLDVPVQRPSVVETTALGAAYLAGLATGFWSSREELRRHWQMEREFHPAIDAVSRQRSRARWRDAVQRCLGWATDSEVS
ncbi:MAG: glycerol kinase GlpK [Planctomycetota bacterium]|nr:glycerol kinase GlpK [Planctomycetota bacterium]